MDDHHDILDRLEDAIGDGPAHRPIDARLSAGRAALRRRRAAVGVGALAMAAVLGGTAWVALPGSDPQVTNRDDAPAFAGDPEADADTAKPVLTPDRVIYRTPAPTPQQRAELLGGGSFLAFAWEGTDLLVRPGWTFVRRLDGFAKGQVSVAATMRSPQGELSNILMLAPGNGIWSPARSADRLEPWARHQLKRLRDDAAANTDDSDMPGTVDGSGLVKITGESLAPVGETTILDQRTQPDLPNNFAKADDPSWVAQVRDDSGAEWFVLVRTVDGSDDYMAVPAADAGNPSTLDAFLDWARPRYESEVGVR
ncbi:MULTISPECIES: hypothetical protein [unclassified Nocardioides]|uniref:hypothetical protein n=1 Tax=unclassified Nocardioides TaxID=2615069 RepID=UPI0006F52128|nr:MULTISPECIES: hypothetical protein [unclassified Nocardioides]KQY57034.1 hypothetical protein ASD30_12280 [Nocardioides sp. Root140]KRF13158.1 hypothetical protein ASH02_16925 [Nocardioides sp. Soil796]